MKSMCPKMRLVRFCVLAAFVISAITTGIDAQTRRSSTSAKPAAKKTTQSKDAKKSASTASKKTATAKSKTTTSKKAATAKSNSASKSKTSNNKSTAQKRSAAPANKKMTAAERRKEAARKKAEEARRQAALAEQRRREQAAREARARKIAFERGLRTETAANILADKTEGEDLEIRQTAVNALGERAGTVVVMEAKTGRVLTMVNQEWAIKQGFKPCSTIKLVTGVAGINEKLIDGDGNITGNSMQMNLDDALARSNNAYFQRVGANLGSEKMIDYAKRLGLGQKTGINAEGETAGKLPYGNNNPRIYSHADDFEVTPLQLAVMVTAIANGGKRVIPQFQRTRTERAAFKSTYRATVNLPDQSIAGVLPGMIGAAEYGTARRGVDASMGVAGKTGSCIGRGSWVGLFASVAPVEDPKYAVVVITRGEGERGRNAAAIAGQIYRALSGNIKRDAEKSLALKQIRSKQPVGTDVAAVDDEDEDDVVLVESSESRNSIANSAPRTPAVQEPAQKKIVTRTSQSKPVFPPVVIQYSKDKGKSDTVNKGDRSRPRVVKNK